MHQESIDHDERALTPRGPALSRERLARRNLFRRLVITSAGLGLAPLLAACGGGGDEEEDDQEQEEQDGQNRQQQQEQEEEEQGGEDEGEDV